MPRTAIALTALLLLASACDDDSTPSVVSAGQGTPDSTGGSTGDSTGDTAGGSEIGVERPDSDAAFEWADFGDGGGVQTGHIEVPKDYDDPSAGSFDLFVARHLADPDQRIGSLLVNPGGPGFGGSDFAVYADQIYSQTLLDHFDIVGWDPRGTGLSEPAIDCVDDYDHFYTGTDITPDEDAERQQLIDLAKEYAGDCASKNDDILQHVGTNDSARDMDQIRQALQEEKISYFGFSYGSELGATWATLFPDTVRAAVLDGAADPTATYLEDGLQQSAGFEGTLSTFLRECGERSDCAFAPDGDAEGAFDALMQSLDDDPIPGLSGRPDVTRAVAISAVSYAMYSQDYWPQLESALASAQQGDGGGLMEMYDAYYSRRADGTYDNSLEAFQVIYCMDTAERLTVEEDDAAAPQFNEVSPRLSPGTVGSYFCTFFPEAEHPRAEITGKGAGPVLVMGTTGDPATPLASTEVMADTLEDGRLVVVTADQHTGYGVNQCSYDVVDNYLVDPVNNAPDDGTTCE